MNFKQLISFFIILAVFSCKEHEPIENLPVEYKKFDFEVKEWLNFDIGSWWLYKSETDSFIFLFDTTKLVNRIEIFDTIAEYFNPKYYYGEIKYNYSDIFLFFNDRYTFGNSNIKISSIYNILELSNLNHRPKLQLFSFPILLNNELIENEIHSSIIEFHDSVVVNNKTFANVIEVEIFSENNTLSYYNQKINKIKFWISKNEWILKVEVFYDDRKVIHSIYDYNIKKYKE